MKSHISKMAAAAIAVAGLSVTACKREAAAPVSAGETATTAEDGTATGTGSTSSSGTGGGSESIPALVSVNLQNVLNNLSVELNVNRNNIPVTAQVPVDVAASVCGVSVSALSASIASGKASCTATTTSAQLTQAVQQQIASGGSVEGGDQNMGIPTGNQM